LADVEDDDDGVGIVDDPLVPTKLTFPTRAKSRKLSELSDRLPKLPLLVDRPMAAFDDDDRSSDGN
jgi:hypothetical protein